MSQAGCWDMIIPLRAALTYREHTQSPRRSKFPMRDIPTGGAIALLVAGGAVGCLAHIAGSDDGGNLSLLLCFTGIVSLACSTVCRTVRAVNRPADDAYNDGYEAGYDKGWRDGHAHARPQVVQFPAHRVRIDEPGGIARSRDSAGI